MTNVPRTEYPRPQFERKSWMNLNGEWNFRFDDHDLGLQEKWYENPQFTEKIVVPFCFESKLSGIGDVSYHDIVWYHREFEVTDSDLTQRAILHFGASDYYTSVWVNGQLAFVHEGGHSSFEGEVTPLLVKGKNQLVVRVEDFSKDRTIPRGKQYWKPQSERIFYTRTTGIWQTVWLEFVHEVHLSRVRMTPDIDRSELEIAATFSSLQKKQSVKLAVHISFQGATIVDDLWDIQNSEEQRTIRLRSVNDYGILHLWSPENPHLYDISYRVLVDGVVVDEVTSYFGMRKISVKNGQLCLNNQPYYLRMVLDQGYFPDGLLTAASDDVLRREVELTKEMGFNGARKHQKVEDPRYLYWCDRLGLVVWGEMANAYEYSDRYVQRMTAEWQEIIHRDYNHPSIIAWVPINESWGVPHISYDQKQLHHALTMYHLTKSLDQSRLVISNDGWEHAISDLLTIHDYSSREEVLAARYQSVERAISETPAKRQIYASPYHYGGEPLLVTEFGGISFKKSDWDGWGYVGAESDEEFIERLEAAVRPLVQSEIVQGFCYTQLTDVEQEINGLLTYDREPKIPLEKIREIITMER